MSSETSSYELEDEECFPLSCAYQALIGAVAAVEEDNFEMPLPLPLPLTHPLPIPLPLPVPLPLTGVNRGGVGKNKLTLEEKVLLVRKLESIPDYRPADAAKEFGIAKSAVSYLLKRKDKIQLDYDRGVDPTSKRSRSLSEFDEALIARILEESKSHRITMAVIFRLANEIAAATGRLSNNGKGPGPWVATCGWYGRFAQRANLGLVLMGEIK